MARIHRRKEELYKKDLHDPDNPEGVITNLEPDILECEVKWVTVAMKLKENFYLTLFLLF